jgi:hypothetical protein
MAWPWGARARRRIRTWACGMHATGRRGGGEDGGGGDGHALAARLAEQGMCVVVTARGQARREAAAAGLRARGLRGAVRFRRLDVADPASVAVFASWVCEELGGLDIDILVSRSLPASACMCRCLRTSSIVCSRQWEPVRLPPVGACAAAGPRRRAASLVRAGPPCAASVQAARRHVLAGSPPAPLPRTAARRSRPVQAGERARVSLLCVRNGGAGLVSVEEGLDWGGLINQHMHFWTGVGLVRIPVHSQVYLYLQQHEASERRPRASGGGR